jgi:hypothetical protein
MLLPRAGFRKDLSGPFEEITPVSPCWARKVFFPWIFHAKKGSPTPSAEANVVSIAMRHYLLILDVCE